MKCENVQILCAKFLLRQLRDLDCRPPKKEILRASLKQQAWKWSRSAARANFEQAPRHTAGGRQSWSKTGLQGVVDIHFAKERPRARPQRVVDLCSPATVLAVDESGGDETPNLTVPAFVNRIAVNRIKKSARSNPLATRPPISVSN